MLEQKAEHGIELTIVGSPVGFGTMMPVPGLDNYAQPLDQLKSFHGWLADTVRGPPGSAGRVRLHESVRRKRAARADRRAPSRSDGFVGLIVNSSVEGRYLDSEEADEFFEMAAELDVPIFLHPGAEPVGSEAVRDFRLVEQVSRFFDVAVSLATLALSGRLEQYPDLKLIAATTRRRDLAGPEPARRGPARSARSSRRRPSRADAQPERLSATSLRRHGQREPAEPASQPGAHGCREDAVRDRLATTRDTPRHRDLDGHRPPHLRGRTEEHPRGQRNGALRAGRGAPMSCTQLTLGRRRIDAGRDRPKESD